jgi:hypothetical protein
MLAFDDDTAIGDRRSIQRFASSRNSLAALEADEISTIEAALKDPVPVEALKATLLERQANGTGTNLLRHVLMAFESQAPPEQIEAMKRAFRSHQAILAAHSKLEVK